MLNKEYQEVIENLAKVKEAVYEADTLFRIYLLLTRVEKVRELITVAISDDAKRERAMIKLARVEKDAYGEDMFAPEEQISKIEEAVYKSKDKFLEPWCKTSLESIKQRIDRVTDLVETANQEGVVGLNNPFIQSSMMNLRGYIEQVEILINYEDYSGALEFLDKSYPILLELEDIVSPPKVISLPESLQKKVETISESVEEIQLVFSAMEGFKEVSEELKQPQELMDKTIERFASEDLDEMGAHQELDKVRLMLDDIKSRSMEKVALDIITKTQNKIDAAKAKQCDVSEAEMLFGELQTIFQEGDLVMARELSNSIIETVDEARKEKVRKSALAYLAPIEKVLNSCDENDASIAQGRHYLTLAKIELEKGNYSKMKEHATKAKGLAKKAKQESIQTEIGLHLGKTEVMIDNLKKEKVDTAEIEELVRESKMMFENNKPKQGKDYAAKAQKKASKLHQKIEEKQKVVKESMARADAEEAQITKQVSGELLDKQAECMQNIQTIQKLAITVSEFGADDTVVMKHFQQAQKAFSDQDFAKAQKYVIMSMHAAKKAKIDHMKSLMAQVQKAGEDPGYLKFLMEHAEFAFENGEFEMGEEYVCNFMDTIEELKTAKPEMFGIEVEEEEEDAGPSKKFCVNCEEGIDYDAAFCPRCGAKQ